MEQNPTNFSLNLVGESVMLPGPNTLTNGAWYGGSPYLGTEATTRAVGPNGTAGTIANPPGFAFVKHPHHEREITTNNIFPDGMMMMAVDSREFQINQSN
jgi:hypothetical protein